MIPSVFNSVKIAHKNVSVSGDIRQHVRRYRNISDGPSVIDQSFRDVAIVAVMMRVSVFLRL